MTAFDACNLEFVKNLITDIKFIQLNATKKNLSN